jgi:arabinan endo-1,5-alpha-L-arabinosidase
VIPLSNNIYPPPPPKIPPYSQVKDDPMKWGPYGAHDTHAFKDPKSGLYYVYSTGKGVSVRRSQDLITWDNLPPAYPNDMPDEVFEHTNSHGVWAADIHHYESEYRLYGSVSTFGSQKSAIVLLVSDNPEGPFSYRGIVIKTDDSSPVNAIDANIITDVHTGDIYMSYGSFWGGIRLIKLDPDTGLAAEKGLGKVIAKRNNNVQTSIEGTYIIYNPVTDYYYLTVSYGSLFFDYNIRVARSRNITGPYIDPNGYKMTDIQADGNSIGFMIACGYRFFDGEGWRGPGHHSILKDGDEWYLIHHVRPANMYESYSTMHVRKLLWLENGWPVCSPEMYAGEELCTIGEENIAGTWERISLTPLTPQTAMSSALQIIRKDGTMLAGSLTGKWRMIDENKLELVQGGVSESVYVLPAWDHECNRPTLVMTGMNEKGIAIWYKKRMDNLFMP